MLFLLKNKNVRIRVTVGPVISQEEKSKRGRESESTIRVSRREGDGFCFTPAAAEGKAGAVWDNYFINLWSWIEVYSHDHCLWCDFVRQNISSAIVPSNQWIKSVTLFLCIQKTVILLSYNKYYLVLLPKRLNSSECSPLSHTKIIHRPAESF